MHSLAYPRITRWITTCIQPKEMAAARAKYTDSGEPEKEAGDDRKAEAAEVAQDAHKTADHTPGLKAILDQDMWATDESPGDAQEWLLRFLITS